MRFQIFGERCSGTNYLEHLLIHNFGHDSVTWEFGHKHWFIDHTKIANTSTEDVVFIAIIRDLSDWIQSFYTQQHHISARIYDRLDFITIPIVSTPETDYKEEHKNVFALRSAKLHDLFKLRETAKNVVYVRYEDLRDNPDDFIVSLSERYNTPTIADDVVHVTSYKGLGKREYKRREYPPFNEEECSIIQRDTDWHTEELVNSYVTPVCRAP